MKKRNLKNLNLKKRSISNLNKNEIKGGTTPSIFTCLSCFICPTLTCTQGDVCDALISLALDEVCVQGEQ